MTANGTSNKHDDVTWPPFNPFLHHPTSRLGKIKMLLTGSVLVPVRLIGVVVTLLLAWLGATLALVGSDPSKPYSPLRQCILFGGCRIFARTLLFFYGYVWIKETYEVKDPKQRAKQPPASVVVCNHVGFAELLFLVARYGCCFVSKESNRNLPVIGKVSEVMQSIFVNRRERGRGGSSSNNSTSAKIIERMQAPPGTWPLLALCPEGTTTTGHIMIHMHTGAFRAGKAVQPVAIRVPFSPVHGYDPSFCGPNILFHVFCLLTQPMNHMHVTHLAVYVPTDAEKADAKLFANNVRRRLAETLGVETYELEWVHKLQFERSERKRELGRKLLAERHGGVVPPPPVFTQDAFGNPLENPKDK
jgi:lysophosphatidylcholine acyltransferase/lyso-PAF acetyltransferase